MVSAAQYTSDEEIARAAEVVIRNGGDLEGVWALLTALDGENMNKPALLDLLALYRKRRHRLAPANLARLHVLDLVHDDGTPREGAVRLLLWMIRRR